MAACQHCLSISRAHVTCVLLTMAESWRSLALNPQALKSAAPIGLQMLRSAASCPPECYPARSLGMSLLEVRNIFCQVSTPGELGTCCAFEAQPDPALQRALPAQHLLQLLAMSSMTKRRQLALQAGNEDEAASERQGRPKAEGQVFSTLGWMLGRAIYVE